MSHKKWVFFSPKANFHMWKQNKAHKNHTKVPNSKFSHFIGYFHMWTKMLTSETKACQVWTLHLHWLAFFFFFYIRMNIFTWEITIFTWITHDHIFFFFFTCGLEFPHVETCRRNFSTRPSSLTGSNDARKPYSVSDVFLSPSYLIKTTTQQFGYYAYLISCREFDWAASCWLA